MFKGIHIKQAAQLSAIISIVLFLMTLTFLKFFIFNPFVTGFTVLGLFQFFSIIGWLLLVVLPPILLRSKTGLDVVKGKVFLLASLFWPAVVLLIRITLLIQVGNPYLTYLVQYPLFVFSDIIVPIIYVVIWKRLQTDERTDGREKAASVASRATPKQDAPARTPSKR